MVANPEVGAPKLRKFYVTFGVQFSHEPHPYWPGVDPAGWLTVLAPDEDAARTLVRSFIGLKWAFLYGPATFNESDDRRHFPKGELCQIDTNGGIRPAEGVEPPTPRFGTSDPEYYGREETEIVGVRIEGKPVPGSDADQGAYADLGYDVVTVHSACAEEARALFESIREEDPRVMAFELDWNSPVHCVICETSIT